MTGYVKFDYRWVTDLTKQDYVEVDISDSPAAVYPDENSALLDCGRLNQHRSWQKPLKLRASNGSRIQVPIFG